MDTEKIVKESQIIMFVTLTVGLALFAAGIIFTLMDINLIQNNKALIGLSFLPLSVACIYFVKSLRIRKSPQKMQSIIINEVDERLVTLKNEADAKAFKIVKGALFLAYMGYTLMVPEDIFESVGWWILLILFFVTFMSQGILQYFVMRGDKKVDEE